MGVVSQGIVIDFTPPERKYPVLWTTLAVCSVACVATGGPILIVAVTTNLLEQLF